MIGLVDRVSPDGSARRRAVELAGELAALPQACLRNDRLSAIQPWGMAEPAAMANELRRGLATPASGEAAAGAVRFALGQGRHGGSLRARSQIREVHLGADHPATARSRQNLAAVVAELEAQP